MIHFQSLQSKGQGHKILINFMDRFFLSKDISVSKKQMPFFHQI